MEAFSRDQLSMIYVRPVLKESSKSVEIETLPVRRA
jgi:hypothetical protein